MRMAHAGTITAKNTSARAGWHSLPLLEIGAAAAHSLMDVER